jgi:hypothetical protein
MSSEAFLRRLGLEGSGGDTRFIWRIIGAILLLYALGFLIWYPSPFPTNTDESMFLTQTRLLLEGRATTEKIDPFTGERFEFLRRPYPNGLPALMAPFMWLGGVRGAYLLPPLSLVAAVLLLGAWLREQGYSPVFALLALGFVPTLVMGRVAMTDVPSLAIVTLGLWLFWRGLDRGWLWWLASAFVAGSAMTVRPTNCLPFIGLYAGTVLRREPRCLALIAGGLMGLGVRLLATYLQHGDPFFERGAYPLDLASIGERLPLHLLALLVLVPGGLVAASAYRGRRRPEVIFSVWLYFAFYLFQEYSTDTTSLAKRIVLALRYFIELLPLLVLGMADAVPRALRALRSRLPDASWTAVVRVAALALVAWLIGLSVASVAVHAYLDRWSAGQAAIAQAIQEHTGDDTVVITNPEATYKFMRQADRRYQYVSNWVVTPEEVTQLVDRHGEVFIVLLDRTDSDYWRERSQQHDVFIASLEQEPVLELDRAFSPTDRLRIWRLDRDGS